MPHRPAGESAPLPPRGRGLRELVTRWTRIDALLDRCRDVLEEGNEEPLLAEALRRLDIEPEIDAAELRRIPAQGPVVLVANHPTGLRDGLVLGAIASRRREDVRILANRRLLAVPRLRDLVIGVDPSAGGDLAANRTGLARAMRWTRAGGCLLVFPSGTVARHGPLRRDETEAPWSEVAVRIARAAGATVIPVHLAGRNSEVYRWLGRHSETLRRALFPRELWRQRGEGAAAAIGEPWRDALEAPAIATDRLRAATLALGALPRRRPDGGVLAELDGLEPDRLVAAGGPFEVWLARRREIPGLIGEIGRLRETTFRREGEGTGLEIDVDDFDSRYWHLVLADRESGRVAGGYRLAPAGPGGGDPARLYAGTLFDFAPEFAARLGPSLELGRSFVHPDYQGEFRPLDLLWRGIGEFLRRRPEIRHLYGCVSMGAAFTRTSRELLVAWMTEHRGARSWEPSRDRAAPSPSRRARPSPLTLARAVADERELSAASRRSNRTDAGCPCCGGITSVSAPGCSASTSIATSAVRRRAHRRRPAPDPASCARALPRRPESRDGSVRGRHEGRVSGDPGKSSRVGPRPRETASGEEGRRGVSMERCKGGTTKAGAVAAGRSQRG
ncbi:MAG: lysophospholipid acyltransferase family protein [Planctomycetota bacterium]